MIQDHQGFMWFGTQSGLLRWDGYRARHYVANSKRGDALADGFILTMHVDPGGRLWIGTSAGGLARYDRERDNFVLYPAGPAGISHARVSALAGDGAGGVWIGTGGGLDHISADGVLRRGAGGGPGIAAADLPQGGVEGLLRDRAGNLWLATRHGLFRRSVGQARLQSVSLAACGKVAPAVSALHQDSAGRIWIGTRTNGALVMADSDSSAQAVLEAGAVPTLQRERVYSIIEVRPDEIWLGTEGGGILVVDPHSGATRRIRHQSDVQDSLNDNDVPSLYRERSGLIFASTNSRLSQYDPHPRAVLTLRQSGTPLDGALNVASLLARANGSIWLAQAGAGGIHIVDPLKGGAGHLASRSETAGAGLPRARVLAMADGPAGEVYLGSEQGLYRTDTSGAKPALVTLAPRSPDASVWALAFQDGALWAGGLDGLWQIGLAPGQPPRVLRRESDSLGDTRVTALLPTPDGGLWIGTRIGLARLAHAGARIEQLPTDAANAGALPPGFVSSLLIDRRGRLWVSMFGVGVVVLEDTNSEGRRRFRRIGVAEGLPHDGVNALLEDRQGMIWASTDNGLARIDPGTYKVQALGPAQGVHIDAYWINSRAMTAQGELLFGGLSGLTVVRPERLAAWRYQAPVVVTNIAVNDVDVPAGPFNAAAKGAALPRVAATISIAPEARERGFALEFAALDYSAVEKNRYAYRLLGFDSRWIGADAGMRRISYNNLPPGDFTLQLRGSNRDGEWSPVVEVAVRSLPQWHQRTWVRVLFGLTGALLVGALVQGRTAYFRRRQRELQNIVDERTAELRATQSQLEVFAYADPLTGLPNRRCFNDELRHMGARSTRENDSFMLLLIDLDHFKQINDTLGHDAGDALLVEAARRLKLALREADRVARLGGDEFAVMLPKTADHATVKIICERIVASMSEPVAFGEANMRISASVGAAGFMQVGRDLDALYKAADVALYQTKARGRNGWNLYAGGERGGAHQSGPGSAQ